MRALVKYPISRTNSITRPYRAPTAYARRSFHATTPNRFFFDPVLPIAHEIFQNAHSITGLPWGLTIPLVSILANATVALPLQYISLKALKKEADLAPLLFAWRNQFRHDILQSERREGARMGPENANSVVQVKTKQKQKQLYKKYGVYRSLKYVPVLQVLVWFPFMDTLRCMSGLESRFLESSGALAIMEAGFENGGLLWFENLFAFDTTLTFLTGLTIWLKVSGIDSIKNFISGKDARDESLRRSPLQRGLRRAVTLYACLIPFIAVINQFPCALMLYWLSGSLFSIPATRFLHHKVLGDKPLFKPAERKEVEMNV